MSEELEYPVVDEFTVTVDDNRRERHEHIGIESGPLPAATEELTVQVIP
jgi:hypothetical protein